MVFFWIKDRSTDSIWRFVPEDALWVYEHSDLGDLWENKLSAHPIEPSIVSLHDLLLKETGAAFWAQWKENEALDAFISGQSIQISGHDLGNKRMGLIFYAQINAEKIELLQQLFAPLSDDSFVVSSRKYLGQTLHEIHHRESKEKLAYLIGSDYFICSFSPFLLEEALRSSTSRSDLYTESKKLQLASSQLSADGNLYVSLAPGASFWWRLGRHATNTSMLPLRYRFSNAYLKTHVFPSHLSWSGFIVPRDSLHEVLLSGFRENLPPPLPYLHLVPNNCSMLWRYGFNDARQWNLNMQALWKKGNHSIIDQRLSLFSNYGIDMDHLFNHIGHLGGVLRLESPPGTPSDRLFLLHLADPKAMQTAISSLNSRLNGSSANFQEPYLSYTIRYLELPDFPYLLFGDDFTGFESLFYVIKGDFLLASSSLLSLRSSIAQIEEEESWGRTPQLQNQLSKEIDHAHICVHINLEKEWNHLAKELSYPWREFFKEPLSSKEARFLSLQLRASEDKFYTQIQLHVPEYSSPKTPSVSLSRSTEPSESSLSSQQEPTQETRATNSSPSSSFSAIEQYEKEVQRSFSSPLISKPLLVYNTYSKDFDILVQEQSNFSLHSLAQNGTSLWTIPLPDPIISPIYLLDYFKNKQMNYLFATSPSIYILDRKGETLPGFPVQLPTSDPILYLNLLDYSQNKNYRLFVSDLNGQAYVLDKKGTPLAGWNPKTLHRLSEKPLHVRVSNRDCMVLFEETGIIHMYRRKGESYPQFPLRIGDGFSGTVFIKKGASLSRSHFISLNTTGELIRASFTGKIEEQRPIYPHLKEATYELVASVGNKSYLHIVSNKEKIIVLNPKGELLFERPAFSSGTPDAQYFDLGTNSVIALHDKPQAKLYLYDLNGKEALPSPLATSDRISLTYSSQRNLFTLYLTQDKQYLKLRYKKPY